MRWPVVGTIAALVLIGVAMIACSGTRVRSGEVGVRVVDIGGNAGVQENELGVGWYFPQPGSYVLKFPTTVRTEVWTDDERAENVIGRAVQFNNADGVPTRMGVSMQVRIDPEKASIAVQRYRLGFEDMVRGPVQRDLQDTFVRVGARHNSQELVTTGGGALLAEVTAEMQRRLSAEGIIIDNINLVGSPALPESIRDRINQRIEAEQNAATQQQQVAVVEAQARQAVARAEGEARAIALLGQALRSNPEVLRQREIERWRGWCPLDTDTCVIGNQALVTTE